MKYLLYTSLLLLILFAASIAFTEEDTDDLNHDTKENVHTSDTSASVPPPSDAIDFDTTNASPTPTLWEGKRILHIGDSHLANWGLRGTLRKRFRQAGASYSASSWVGSSSRSWLGTGRLQRLIRERRPNVVIVNLGINIIRSKTPEAYAKYITKLAAKITPKKCYWIAPPSLIEDKHGFYEMLQEATKPCAFFDSRQLTFDVAHKKRFHLNHDQSQYWAEKIWEWINTPSSPTNTPHGI